MLGVSLGLIFTPCAGPVIGAVATVAATQDLGLEAVLITLAYGLGAGLVLLGVAIAARRGMNLGPVRAHAPLVRRALGVAVLAVAVLMIYGVDRDLRTRVPEYTRALQALEESGAAQTKLEDLVGTSGLARAERLDDYGLAPEFAAIEEWVNSPPLTISGLRGKVVLLDFWTYSCINCLRTLPYIRAWYDEYRDDGLVIVGVHTPEFAFEREPDNVRRAVRDQEIEYPVALDNEYGTWEAFQNRYWPAKYFVDRRGRLRYVHFGEGDYEESERVIRELLAEDASGPLVSEEIEDETPSGEQTPETYLGYQRLDRFVGSRLVPDKEADVLDPEARPAPRRRLRRPLDGRGRADRGGEPRPAAARLPWQQRLPRPGDRRRAPDGRGDPGRRAGGHRAGDPGRPLHARANPGRQARPRPRPRFSRRGPRLTRSLRVARSAYGLVFAVLPRPLLVLLEEAGELGRE